MKQSKSELQRREHAYKGACFYYRRPPAEHRGIANVITHKILQPFIHHRCKKAEILLSYFIIKASSKCFTKYCLSYHKRRHNLAFIVFGLHSVNHRFSTTSNLVVYHFIVATTPHQFSLVI